MLQTTAPRLDSREQHYWIASPRAGLRLFLRRLSPAGPPEPRGHCARPVLYVHGATFPSGLSIAHRFDGFSWRDALCAAGFDVWGLDFHGFGHSDRYPEMEDAPDAHAPLCRTEDASAQLEAAVCFIRREAHAASLSIIAHSWGSMPTCQFAGRHPTQVERLVLFGPIARRPPRRYEAPPRAPAWRIVSPEDQWARFIEDVPPQTPPVLSRAHFEAWEARYLESDPNSRTRKPPSVKIPTGPFLDILKAWHGQLAYDPALVQAPVAIVRGAWDGLIPDEDARWLFDAFCRAPVKRDIKIDRATHLMHLEAMRFALYSESINFLLGDAQRLELETAHAQRCNSQKHQGGHLMDLAAERSNVPGYTMGTAEVAKSPISIADWEELKKSALFSEEDVVYLRLSRHVLEDQVDDLLKTWRGIIFDHPHLRAYDEDPNTGEVDSEYAKAVGKRFGQWVIDTAKAQYDQAWLDYQYEIGLRHHRTKKNKTDAGHTRDHIRARDLIAFSAAIVVPMKPFLAKKGHPPEVVNRMYDAWWKSMILQVALWSQPYIKDGDF
jgi:pimeloyl-ACP methyl ester carboxylesterase